MVTSCTLPGTTSDKVNLISSVHTSATFQKSLRAKAAPNHRRVVEKPKAVELYTKYMQGVDRGDQLLWYKLHLHKSLKWWKKVFMYLLEVSLVNASIIYVQEVPQKCDINFISHGCGLRTSGGPRQTRLLTCTMHIVSRNVTGWHGIHRRLAQEIRPNRTVSYVHSVVLDQNAIRLRQYANSVVFLFVLFLVSSAFILLLTTRWSARRNTIDRLSNRVTLVVLAVRHLLIQRPITCNLFKVTSAVIAFVSELICV